MMVLSTANILLFIALNLGPQHPSQIFATSLSENYVWTAEQHGGWHLTSLGFPASDTERNPEQSCTVDQSPDRHAIPAYMRDLGKYNWDHDGIVVFDNGDRIEKRGKYGFYIINAGAANQKTFTILFPTKDDPETIVQRQEK